MKTPRFTLLLLCWMTVTGLSAQNNNSLLLKLQLLPDGETWGVFVKPDSTIFPSPSTITGSGQVTLVAPHGFTYASLQNVSGTWVDNARVNALLKTRRKTTSASVS